MEDNFKYLNGIKTYAFKSKKELIDSVINKNSILIAITGRKIVTADEPMRQLINQNIGYTDGAGAVWALKKHGFKYTTRIPGCELWLEIIKTTYKSKSFYLIGAKQEVIGQTVNQLKLDFPGINILNYRNGYINSDQEKIQLINDIKSKKPDIIFVAAGYPIQEILMNEMKEVYPALYMGLGGSYDVYIGNVKRAPFFFRKFNLEWFHRLLIQPSRIKRQVHLVRFAFLVMIGKI